MEGGARREEATWITSGCGRGAEGNEEMTSSARLGPASPDGRCQVDGLCESNPSAPDPAQTASFRLHVNIHFNAL